MMIDLPQGVHWLQSGLLSQVPELTHGFSTRLAAAAPASGPDVTGARGVAQVHDIRILVAEDAPADDPAACFDGLATGRPGVALAVRTADCVPVLLVEREGRAAAALHAGWRGTVGGIASVGVRLLRERFGVEPAALVAALGPAIGACCYEVDAALARRFADRFGRDVVRRDRGPRPHVDLIAANRVGLVEAGLSPDAVEALDRCTRCRDDLFPSYRREGEAAGRLWSFVRLASDRLG